jgi:S-adenosylmethionine hydrolase
MVATLLTDFGLRDPYVATMKGVMISLCPDIHIVDLSHAVAPHDILGAGFILAQSVTSFPLETVHVIVVDPDVGTDREILAARFGGQYFVFPDNGVISFIAAGLPLEQIVAVRDKRFFRTTAPSGTFHGRDILAPVAARILMGLDLRRLGPTPDRYKILDLPRVVEKPGELTGQVLYVDRFGNLITNITDALVRHRWDEPDRVRVYCNGRDIGPLKSTYGGGELGQPLAIINSMGLLEIATNRGRASYMLDAHVGAEVRVGGAAPPAKEKE